MLKRKKQSEYTGCLVWSVRAEWNRHPHLGRLAYQLLYNARLKDPRYKLQDANKKQSTDSNPQQILKWQTSFESGLNVGCCLEQLVICILDLVDSVLLLPHRISSICLRRDLLGWAS